jgi:leucyl/phenylalanyl-tRNA--protein transferase
MILWLDPNKAPYFPDTATALSEPNGLLAAGGQLNIEWLIAAYHRGIFPWFSDDEPILWWTPAPRTILLPANFHASHSLKKLIRQQKFQVSQNQCFDRVIRHCAKPRQDQAGTWVVEPMIDAYIAMHEAGLAHSFECWNTDNELVGGLYGISLGRVFFGESMFSRVSNASKLCLNHLIESRHYDLIDCQMATNHLMSLGAIEVKRSEFETLLDQTYKQ